jgi:hypothetical protein
MQSLGMSVGPTGLKTSTQAETSELAWIQENRRQQELQAQIARDKAAAELGGRRVSAQEENLAFKRDPREQFQTEEAKGIGREISKARVASATNIKERVETASSILPKLTETYELINKESATTGFADKLRSSINDAQLAAAKFFNLDTNGENWVGELQTRVQDTQNLRALLGSEVFPQIKLLGIGARGIDTPAERDFLLQVLTGSTSMDAETLKVLLARRITDAYGTVQSYNEDLESGVGEIGSMSEYAPELFRPVKIKTHFRDFGNDSEKHLNYLQQVMSTRPGSPMR